MSQYSRSAKPEADKTIPEEEIFAVDREETQFTTGVVQPGWVRRKVLGNGRVVHETLVAMVTPPTDEDFEEDDDKFPNTARQFVVNKCAVGFIDNDGVTETEDADFTAFDGFAYVELPIGATAVFKADIETNPLDDDQVLYKWARVIDYSGDTYVVEDVTNFGANNTTLLVDISNLSTLPVPIGNSEGDDYYEFVLLIKSRLGAQLPNDLAQENIVGYFGIDLIDPSITVDTQPLNIVEDAGDAGVATVAASIFPAYVYTLSYQWYQIVDLENVAVENNATFSGATTNELTIADVDGLDGAEFFCRITATGPVAVAPIDTDTISVTVNI
jgi:hypothetical protein